MSEIEFNELELEPAGAIEHTDLTDIDRALRNFFGRQINSLVVIDTERKENREFARFQQKPIKEKMYIGQFDDPKLFMKELSSKVKERKELLPACYLSRGMDLAYCDGDDYADMPDFATLDNDQGQPYAIVSKSFLKLTYTLTAVAWNKETCSRLAVGLSMPLRVGKKGRPHAFKAKSMIAGAPVELHIEINQPRLAVGMAIPSSFADDRLSAVSFDFEVIAEVLEAREVGVTARCFIVDEPEVVR